MLTINVDCEVLPDRLVTIKLPETVRVGHHELVIVVEENAYQHAENVNAKKLMRFAGAVTAFNSVDAVEYQKSVRSEWN